MQQLPESMACAARSAEVINKEEKEKKQKNKKKRPDTDTGIGYRVSESESADFHQRSVCRRPVVPNLMPDDFFDPERDAVDLAVTIANGTTRDRRLWRTYLRNGSITECDFRQCVYEQWNENTKDGYPRNTAACLQAKLNRLVNGNGKKTND